MNIANWLQNKNLESFPLLGIESFESFTKLCSIVSKWALDDSGLANRSDSYKIWVCWVKDTAKLKDSVSKYKSMNLLSHYLDVEIVENSQIGLYIKLDWLTNKWQITYGITNNKKLFKIGEFDYTINTKLPNSSILKYINDEIGEFNPRTHYMLRIIKKSLYLFDPGYCQRQDPYIINNQCILSCYGLGQWTDNNTMNEDEAYKWVDSLKTWVATKEWWNSVKLTCKVRTDKWIDFIIELK